MITCQHARQLFDRYLDGELSPSLQAELHAHQLSCSACQTELAILEACGDVIMLDRRREPRLSDSFTDRVLMARRAQLVKQPRRRNWGRTLVLVGSPLAAAASIALVLTLMWPTASQRTGGRIAGTAETLPPGAARTVTLVTGGTGSTQMDQNGTLPVREMPASSFMESLLSSVVERTTQTIEGTRSGLSQLGLLLQQALTDPNAQLAANEESSVRKTSQPDRTDAGEQDLPGLIAPNPDSASESGSDLLLDPI